MKVCIYHRGCADGFAAAQVFRRAHPSCGYYLPLQYGTPLLNFLAAWPDIEWSRAEVYMLDVTFPTREEHIQFWELCASLTIIDHHKTAAEKLRNLPGPATHFDMEESGATLTAKVLQQPVTEFLQYIRDRDLWLWELPDSRAFSAALASYPMEFDVWDRLEVVTLGLLHEGEAILRYQQQIISRVVRAAKVRESEIFLLRELGVICKYTLCNCTTLISEIGNALVKEYDLDFACLYFFSDKDQKWIYSLRSEGDFDVSSIARMFGGGGHLNAAGFSSRRLSIKGDPGEVE